MTDQQLPRNISRRDFIKLAGGALLAAGGMAAMPPYLRRVLSPVQVAQAAPNDPHNLFFASTDGWIHLPPTPGATFHPDPIGPGYPDGLNTYIFGFRNVTGLPDRKVSAQKMKAQHVAPTFWVKQFDPTPGLSWPANNEFRLALTNLGLQIRPDLVDPHTVHWHGFRDAIPFFDGEPHGSVSVPVGRNITYVYRSREPGTYMYHCHVEDVEHVHMGMTGVVFTRPAENDKWAYSDPSTAFDREFVMLLTEVWNEVHWDFSHIQLPEWSEYHVDFALLNGRVYPDTLAPNGSIDPFNPVTDPQGDLIPVPGFEHLQYQPLSALVTCNEGERVLLRFANLGFKHATMTLAGIPMTIVGKDATLLRGRDGTTFYYNTNTIGMGAGESFDAIFTAPPFSGGAGSSGQGYDAYLLYNRAYSRSSNKSGGYGGQMTEVRVFPSGGASARPPQAIPNT